MTSVGNDIVSLDHIYRTRTLDQRFYSKFLDRAELNLYPKQYSSSLSLDAFIWLGWSVKEAAFKYLKRIMPDLVFCPIRFVLGDLLEMANSGNESFPRDSGDLRWDHGRSFWGKVGFGSHSLHFRSSVQKEFVHTVVLEDANFNQVISGIRRIGHPCHEEQSKAVRVFALEKLSRIFPNSGLRIEKTPQGYPQVVHSEGRILPIPVSFSHDGTLVAYCFPEC